MKKVTRHPSAIDGQVRIECRTRSIPELTAGLKRLAEEEVTEPSLLVAIDKLEAHSRGDSDMQNKISYTADAMLAAYGDEALDQAKRVEANLGTSFAYAVRKEVERQLHKDAPQPATRHNGSDM